MSGEWLLATQLAAATLVLGLALFLCYLDFQNRAVRAFAAFLVVRCAISLILLWPNIAGEAVESELARILEYYHLAAPFFLGYFLVIYGSAPRPAPRWALPTFSLAGAAVVLAYGFDHALLYSVGADGIRLGPLGPVWLSLNLVEAAGALALIGRTDRVDASARHSILLVALGLLVDATATTSLFLGALAVAPDPQGYVGPGGWIAVGIPALAFALALAGGYRAMRSGAPWAGWLIASVAVSTLAIGAALLARTPAIAFGLVGFWRILFPVLIAVALLRHRLFGIDVRARTVLNSATLGAFFAAVFFVVSESVASVLGPRMGTFAGIGAAGLLLFAIAPMQHVAQRIIQTALGPPPPEKTEFYRAMARQAWDNGSLSRDERRFLDDLRARLGLSFEEAARIESEVARAPLSDPLES